MAEIGMSPLSRQCLFRYIQANNDCQGAILSQENKMTLSHFYIFPAIVFSITCVLRILQVKLKKPILFGPD